MDKNTNDMKENPRETANILSILFFWWMRELFMTGAKRDLEESDIYRPVKGDESEKLTDHLEKYWNRELDKLKNLEFTMSKDGQKVPLKGDARPRLYKAIFNAFWLPCFIIGVYQFIPYSIIRLSIPIFQSWIIDYFARDPTGKNKVELNDVLIYIACLILCSIICLLIIQHSAMLSLQFGMRIRVACSSLLYRKLLRLNRTSINQTGTGQIINLLSNDVIRFDQLTKFLNFIWIMPLQITIIGYITWQKIGFSTLIGIGSLLIIAPIVQGFFSIHSRKLRAMIAPLTDRRVQIMSELVAGIQVVKMYAWEKPFGKIVSVTRKLEINKIKFLSYARAMCLATVVFTQRLSLYFTLITFVLTGNNLTADVTYEMTAIFNILERSAVFYFPQALIMMGETIVSMNRLEDLLLMEEVKMGHSEKNSQLQSQKSNDASNPENRTDKYISKNRSIKLSEVQGLSDFPVCVEFQHVSANWISGKLPPTLCNINLIIKPGQLCAMVGAVGSGKSSMLHLLLKELNPGAGSVTLIQDSSKNLIQGNLSNGYFTNNPNLRISYASQEPCFFGGTVRDNILFGQPYDKARYTQVVNVCALKEDFRQFPQEDMTMVGDRGVFLSGGQRARINLARAVYRQADLYLLDDPLSAVDTRVARHLYTKCITDYLHGKTRILVTHQLQFLKRADHIVVLDQGLVKMQGSYNELVQSNNYFIEMMNNLNREAQKNEEEVKRASEIAIRKISLMRRASDLSTASSTIHSDIDDSDYVENIPEGEMMARGRISGRVYKEYFHYGGNYFILLMLLLSFVISQIAATGNDYWLSYWINLENIRRINNVSDTKQYANMYSNNFLGSIFTLNPDGLLSTVDAIYVYTFCIIACAATTLFSSFLYMKICMNSSCNLHNTMFSNLMNVPMSFFNTNPSGRILNRFSKDMGTMDEMLPTVMLQTLQIICFVCGVMIIQVILNPWMSIIIMVLTVLLFFTTKFYVSTAQNVKRLEGKTKSPIFSHVNATLNGLPTIRSSGAVIEKIMRQQFDVLQDRHSGTWYLSLACFSAFGVFTDIIMCLFVGILCYSLVLLNKADNIDDSKIGLAISQSLILIGRLQHGIRQITETMSLMTSVERILQYTNLPKEEPVTSDNPPPTTWPPTGQLCLKNVSMKYNEDDPPVLKNLNVTIEPGWKVGVVGRTGAGKSSLISALFRLFNEGLEGEIKIDGRDTSTVGLSELRSKISIIPQEPVLFSESLRYNLDPFNQYDDMKLWEVLRQVELNDIALDNNIFSGGHNFSVGQRQLICLARAILRNNRLLVLDEATANIDSHTDALIQKTIRKNFKECTVITIAHRLNTIIDSNRIIVMENGSIVEFGCPYELLHDKPNGYFSQMVEKTGKQMALSLLEQAKKACQKNNDQCELNSSARNTESESDGTITEQSTL